jgi:hypothetical protein
VGSISRKYPLFPQTFRTCLTVTFIPPEFLTVAFISPDRITPRWAKSILITSDNIPIYWVIYFTGVASYGGLEGSLTMFLDSVKAADIQARFLAAPQYT